MAAVGGRAAGEAPAAAGAGAAALVVAAEAVEAAKAKIAAQSVKKPRVGVFPAPAPPAPATPPPAQPPSTLVGMISAAAGAAADVLFG